MVFLHNPTVSASRAHEIPYDATTFIYEIADRIRPAWGSRIWVEGANQVIHLKRLDRERDLQRMDGEDVEQIDRTHVVVQWNRGVKFLELGSRRCLKRLQDAQILPPSPGQPPCIRWRETIYAVGPGFRLKPILKSSYLKGFGSLIDPVQGWDIDRGLIYSRDLGIPSETYWLHKDGTRTRLNGGHTGDECPCYAQFSWPKTLVETIKGEDEDSVQCYNLSTRRIDWTFRLRDGGEPMVYSPQLHMLAVGAVDKVYFLDRQCHASVVTLDYGEVYCIEPYKDSFLIGDWMGFISRVYPVPEQRARKRAKRR